MSTEVPKGYKPEFLTARGKKILISQSALEEAEKRCHYDAPEEGCIALSRSFLPPSTTHAVKQGGCRDEDESLSPSEFKIEEVEETQEEDVVVFATSVNPPIFYLAHKRRFASARAAAQVTPEPELKKPIRWHVGWRELQARSPLQEARSFFGTLRGGGSSPVKVILWTRHGDHAIQEGRWYKLHKFESRQRNELWSTDESVLTALELTPAPAPPKRCLGIDEMMVEAEATTTNVLADCVVKIVDVGTHSTGVGQNVKVEDFHGKMMKIKFQYGLDGEGLGAILQPGMVAAFEGLQIHVPVTKCHRMLFSTEFSLVFVAHPMPEHLVEAFEMLTAAKVIEDEEMTNSAPLKRALSPSNLDDGPNKRAN